MAQAVNAEVADVIHQRMLNGADLIARSLSALLIPRNSGLPNASRVPPNSSAT